VKKLTIALLVSALAVGLVVGGAAGKSAKSTAASVQVCVLLPDTKSSVRWEQFDRPSFAKALKAAGLTYSIVNALNDAQKQIAQAEQCIANGATILRPLTATEWGTKDFYVEDPDGYVIAFGGRPSDDEPPPEGA